jgi:hypothetical protein
VATYTPYVSTGYGLASLAFNNGVGYFAGTAAAEGYATDAATGALLWEAADKRDGTTALAENTLNTWLDVGDDTRTLRRCRLFGQPPGKNKLRAGSRLLVSRFPEIKFIACCCGVL